MKKTLLSFCFAISFLPLRAQDNTIPSFVSDSLESYINRGMAEWKIPGLSIGIVKNGEVIYLKGFGFKSINGNEPVDENTLFMIGSNTKAFTSTLLSILQEEKKLNLNDNVQKWMPEFKLKDSLIASKVNITDLLSHRIGFETFQGDFTYWSSSLSRMEVIQKMGLIEAPYGFRTKWGYCNAAFVTAGEIIPRVIRSSWEEAIKSKILAPLKMNQTLMLSGELINASNAAAPHTIIAENLTEIPIPNLESLSSAGGMSSNVSDMTKWLIALLNNGQVNSEQILPERALKAIKTPSSIVGLDQRNNRFTHFYLYGLGLFINDRDGTLVYSHGGAVDGFLSQVMFIPEEQLGIVVLTNTDKNNFYNALTNEIRDAFLGLPYQNHSSKSLGHFKQNQHKEVKRIDSLKNITCQKHASSIPLEEYSGNYNNELYGDIVIKLENNVLNIYFSNHPNLIGKLEYLNNNKFLCTYSNPIFGIKEIPFKIEKDKVTGLTLRVADFIEFTSYEFIKMN